MKKQINLKWQLILYILVFLFGVLGLIFTFQLVFLQEFYTNSKINSIKTVSQNIGQSLPFLEEDSTLKYFQEQARDYDVCIRINYTGDLGTKSYTVDNLKGCSLVTMTSSEVYELMNETIDNGGTLLTEEVVLNDINRLNTFLNANIPVQYIESDTESYIYSAIYENDEYQAVVMVSTFVEPLSATVTTLRDQIGYIYIIVSVSAISLALILSKKIVNPIAEVTENAKQLPSGNYQTSNRSKTYLEVSLLNETLIEANEKIRVADKAKRDLIANVSHDLRTPLTMISGYGEMMRDLPNENNQENAQVIIDESKRLSTLVNDLIDLSGMQDEKISLRLTNVSIHHLLKTVYKQYEKYVRAEGFSFDLKLATDCNVTCDDKRMQQVLHNFISNAINYSSNTKSIVLKQEIIEDVCRISVIDSGNGIAEKDLTHIWDRYYKVDKEHVRSSFGSGIGLAICKEILEKHQIQFGVTSKLGEGSCFYFEFSILNEKK